MQKILSSLSVTSAPLEVSLGHISRNSPRQHEQLVWLRRVRWAAIVGYTLVYLVAQYALMLSLAWETFFTVQLILILSNLALYWPHKRTENQHFLGAVLVLDVLLLTVLLLAYGGHANPFSMVYLVHVVLAALFISHAWTWVLAILSSFCFAALFIFADPQSSMNMHAHGQQRDFDLHLQGMLVAFVLLSFLIAAFVSRMRVAIDRREREILQRSLHEDRLASLTQLAAGAAHELGTPLATMKIIATELSREIRDDAMQGELRCLNDQLDRCADIVRKMSLEGDQVFGEVPTPCEVSQIIATLENDFRNSYPGRLNVAVNDCTQALNLPLESVIQALRSLIKNAFDASDLEAAVLLRVYEEGELLKFEVQDRGTGIASEMANRLAEPFATTKEVGRGMGLGLYLCRLLVTRWGGALHFKSSAGFGTLATMIIPQRVEWTLPHD